MKRLPKLTKDQRELLERIRRNPALVKTTIIRDGQTRTMNALLKAGYIEPCHQSQHLPCPEAEADTLRITNKGRVALLG